MTNETAISTDFHDDNFKSAGGSETILLVEDEPLILAFASRALRAEGYRVLEATNGEQALDVARNNSGQEIQLLVADVVMPRLGGLDLAERFKEVHQETPVLFTSGYADQAEFDFLIKGGSAFLPKPYDPGALAMKVREVLDK